MDDSEDLGLADAFPEEPRPPSPEPTIQSYRRPSAPDHRALQIRLVGSHSLWGHYLWNAARLLADYLDQNAESFCKGKRVLELGAGGGLPGLVCALNGAAKVVLTDYTDAHLLRNLEVNVENNIPVTIQPTIQVKGFIWGRSPADILAQDSTSSPDLFDVIIMSDLIFNHSQHDALLTTAEQTLSTSSSEPASLGTSPTPCVLVFYTHHRPHLAYRDLEFFSKAKSRGWICEEFMTEKMNAMFPDDPGDEEIRSTVHGWRLRR